MIKAFRFHQHGGVEVMQWEDVDLPPPAAGQVRMRNTAVAVNYRDVLMRRGVHAVRGVSVRPRARRARAWSRRSGPA